MTTKVIPPKNESQSFVIFKIKFRQISPAIASILNI